MDELYRFNPTEDITAYELSLIMKEMMIILINSFSNSFPTESDDKLEIEEASFRSLPIEVRRHFKKN